MELLIRCAALGLVGAMCGLILKRQQPELAFALTAVTLTVILLGSGVLLESLLDTIREAEMVFGETPILVRPVLKCLAIAAVSRFGADLCRDASQTALASALDTAGTLCAAAVAMPAILTTLTTIGGML